jgi:hypothetical protein
MDTNDLLAHSRAKFDHAAAKRILKEKYQAKMIFGYRGGMFSAGPELLILLQSLLVNDDVVILDLYQNPIKISPLELQQVAFDRWQEQMNAWLLEFEQNNQQR